jgi:hypothetical protein
MEKRRLKVDVELECCQECPCCSLNNVGMYCGNIQENIEVPVENKFPKNCPLK